MSKTKKVLAMLLASMLTAASMAAVKMIRRLEEVLAIAGKAKKAQPR